MAQAENTPTPENQDAAYWEWLNSQELREDLMEKTKDELVDLLLMMHGQAYINAQEA
jgi:hypothetical protein